LHDFQKAANGVAKDGLLQSERPSFTMQKATFCNAADNRLAVSRLQNTAAAAAIPSGESRERNRQKRLAHRTDTALKHQFFSVKKKIFWFS
jgi:hypothetical protein